VCVPASLWRIPEPLLAEAQDDATILAIRAQKETGLYCFGYAANHPCAPQWLLFSQPAQELLVPPGLDRNRPIQARLLGALQTRRQEILLGVIDLE
jgi:hypothetical protein